MSMGLDPGSSTGTSRSVTVRVQSGKTCQRYYRHGIPRDTGESVLERISLTFRQLMRAPGED